MGPGTIQSKVEPISLLPEVEEIIFIRKRQGPKLKKVRYIVLPRIVKFKLFNLLITPIILLFYTLKYKPAFILSFNHIPYAYFAGIVGRISNTPSIFTQTGISIEQKVNQNRFINITFRYFIKKAYAVICTGSKSLSFWKKQYPKLSRKFSIIHCTVDIKRFNLNKNSIRTIDFAYLGYLDKNKNINSVIEAFHDLIMEVDDKKLNLHIIGDGPERKNLELLSKKLNLSKNIVFEGFKNKPEIFLQNSKYIVIASHSEGLPTSLMQGMSCGAVPITNEVGNISDLVTSRNGVLFSGTSKERIHKAFKFAINLSSEEYRTYQTKAIETVQTSFNYSIAKNKWRSLFLIEKAKHQSIKKNI